MGVSLEAPAVPPKGSFGKIPGVIFQLFIPGLARPYFKNVF